MEKLLLNQKCMSFGNSTKGRNVAILALLAAVLVGGVLVTNQIKAASNCGAGPSYDSVSKTLSLVCNESTDIHELSCSDPTNPDTLSLSVNGSNETITCLPDLPPNTVPSLSISGPTSGDYGVSYTFTITGTDAEGDTLTYYIDWNNDGTADFVSGVLPSGTGQAAAYSWSVVGAQTFQAQAIDSKGGTSPWTPHTITIGNPPAVTTPEPQSTTRELPNFTRPDIRYETSKGYDAATGEYDSVTVTFQTGNYGGSDATNNANYKFQFDRANGYEFKTNGSLGRLAVGEVFKDEEIILDVPFGPTRILVELDDYPGVGAVAEIDETNNYQELSFNLPPPNPGLTITANRTQVKSGETVTLTWDTVATYAMNCRVVGPGISPAYTFDPSVNGPTGGSPLTSGPITAKSEFTLSCVEDSTGRSYTFTDSVTVETQGKLEEI